MHSGSRCPGEVQREPCRADAERLARGRRGCYRFRMALNPKYVDPNYRHHPKYATPQAPLNLSGARLKWYDLHRADRPVPPAVRELARSHLTAAQLGFDGELGFVILHRCGEEFYFLITCTWRGNNELWETVYYKENDATPVFSMFPREDSHKPAFCVWELGPVLHEKNAWEKFLLSSRDEAAEHTYLRDTFSGEV